MKMTDTQNDRETLLHAVNGSLNMRLINSNIFSPVELSGFKNS